MVEYHIYMPLSQDILTGLDVAKTSTIALIPLENNLRSLISKFETEKINFC